MNPALQNTGKVQQSISQLFLDLIPISSTIIKLNTDIQTHIQVTICLKNLIKLANKQIK